MRGESIFGQFVKNQKFRLEETLKNYKLVNGKLEPRNCNVCPAGRESNGINGSPTGAVYIMGRKLFEDIDRNLILFKGEKVPEFDLKDYNNNVVSLFQSYRDDDVALAYCPELNSAKRFKMLAVPNIRIDPRRWFPYDQLGQEHGVYDAGCRGRTIAICLEHFDDLEEVIAVNQTVHDNLSLGKLTRTTHNGEQADLIIRQAKPEELGIYFNKPDLMPYNGLITSSGRRLERIAEDRIVPEQGGILVSPNFDEMAEFLTGQPRSPDPTRYRHPMAS